MNWKDKINKKYLQISLYVIVTIVIIYFLIQIISTAPVILLVAFKWLKWFLNVIKPVIIGFVFAYIMEPVVAFFEDRYRKLKTVRFFKKVVHPRTWAAFTSVFLMIMAVAGLISLLVFTVTNQIRLASIDDLTKLAQNFINSFNGFYQTILDRLGDLNFQTSEFEKYVSTATTAILNGLKGFVYALGSSIGNISTYLTTIIFSFIIGFYFLIDGKMFINYIRKVSKALFSEKANKRLRGFVHDLDEVFSGYIRGQLTDALVMMVLISLVLTITGVKFAVVIGIFAGVGNLIPYFGPIVAYIGTTVVCLINGDVKRWIIAMIALFLIQALDGNLIGPKLLSRSIKIHPLIIIVSIIFGSALGGFLGMLLAVPVGAYVKLVVIRFVDRRLEKKEEVKKE